MDFNSAFYARGRLNVVFDELFLHSLASSPSICVTFQLLCDSLYIRDRFLRIDLDSGVHEHSFYIRSAGVCFLDDR